MGGFLGSTDLRVVSQMTKPMKAQTNPAPNALAMLYFNDQVGSQFLSTVTANSASGAMNHIGDDFFIGFSPYPPIPLWSNDSDKTKRPSSGRGVHDVGLISLGNSACPI